VGNKAVSATYSGDANYNASSGNRTPIGPTVVPHVKSAHQKHNGWYRSPVHVSFTCTANTAPVVECPGTRTRSKNRAGQSVTVTVRGTDGGETTVSVSPINIDQVDPKLKVKQVGHKVTCRAHDKLSGGATCKVKRNSTTTNGVKTVRWKAVAHDRAGNKRVERGRFQYLV
jgi:adhesin/invasin